jgi:uncharacterized protein YjlB
LSRSDANEQIVWLLKSKMEFLFGSKQRACGQGDVIVMPGGTEHEAWFREGTEVMASFPARRQTRLHERRLNSSLRLSQAGRMFNLHHGERPRPSVGL